MAFTTALKNTENFRKFDFDVYIIDTDMSDYYVGLNGFQIISSDDKLNSFINKIYDGKEYLEITKIERSTIIANTEDGDSIDTNDGQTNIIDKNGNVSLSLVSVTLDAIKTLRGLNRKDVSFLFVEKCNDKRFLVFIPVATLKYNESFTSGDVLRLPILSIKQVSKLIVFVLFHEYTEVLTSPPVTEE